MYTGLETRPKGLQNFEARSDRPPCPTSRLALHIIYIKKKELVYQDQNEKINKDGSARLQKKPYLRRKALN